MKRFIIIILSLVPIFCWSQVSTSRSSTPIVIAANTSHLYIDYEVKHNSHPDENTLNAIDLSQYESQRLQGSDVEVYDATSGYILILYSNEKSILNKKKNSDQEK